ncbi:MAG: hypothetical protein V8R83_09325 [Candidatus Gastranaerophilaceae bacterium]|jgi:hypothetical protein|nr:MAG TPA: hypothetical protein [Caudoviricetes sp.]
MFDVPKAVESVSNAIKGIFDYASTSKEHQSETQIIKDKKKLKEAVNIAEEILLITDNYQVHFSDEDWKQYKKLKKKFNKKD